MKCTTCGHTMSDDGKLIFCPKCKFDAERTSAFDKQEGGGHYKNMPIQPAEFIERNKLSFLEGCIVKRICRWRKKDGIKDLNKIKHEVDMLIEMNFEDVPAECPHGHGDIMRSVLKYTEGDDNERTQGQSHAEGGEGDERKTHTSVSPEHERGYTVHATDMAEGRQGAVLPVVPRS